MEESHKVYQAMVFTPKFNRIQVPSGKQILILKNEGHRPFNYKQRPNYKIGCYLIYYNISCSPPLIASAWSNSEPPPCTLNVKVTHISNLNRIRFDNAYIYMGFLPPRRYECLQTITNGHRNHKGRIKPTPFNYYYYFFKKDLFSSPNFNRR